LKPPFHLTTTRDRNLRRLGHVIHSTGNLPLIDRETLDGLPITSPTRTLVDLARWEPLERLTAAVDAAFRDGLSTESLLRRRIAALRSKGRFGVPVLLDILDGRSITRGGASWLEREFLRLVAEAGLPRPQTQQVLSRAGDHLVRVDCRFAGTRVVVELLGYRWHRTKQQMAKDAERYNALVLDGFVPYQFTYDNVVDTPERVIATVTAALAARSA
jgi:very-short-patch-repair endonuclease